MKKNQLLSASSFSGGGQTASAELFTLRNANGLAAQFTNYGARWVSMWVPDRFGHMEDILLGFDTCCGYASAGEKYHGAIVGRVCGRVSNATFTMGSQEYKLAANDVYGKPAPNHLHGGVHAFHNCFWESLTTTNQEGEESVVFSRLSCDGEEGYPGHLLVEVTYTLKNTNVLSMECRAVCNKQTPVNLTNHAFFNLQGEEEKKSILSHYLRVNALNLIECDKELIPTGRLIPVADTSLDFCRPRMIRDSLAQSHPQIMQNKGFSVAFALDKGEDKLWPAAELIDEGSGRMMHVSTNQPSLQVYTGYFMDGTDRGKGHVPYYASAGIALETQGFPDAVNQTTFPSVFVHAGDTYRHLTEYRFDVC